ncbi:carbohydrate ABC transporter permease [Planosporangium sp. 12N6]|uniref:carbohydrate ABC transporter permease n=1 Tax=Planosporangium spinosum TaxID=3402278 RepID=UPI003CECF6CC
MTTTGTVVPTPASAIRRSRRPAGPATRGADRAPRPGAAYVLPAAVFFLAFAVVPVIGVFVLSFTSWQGLDDPRFIGLENWRRLTTDPAVLKATGTTVALTALSWVTQTPAAIAIGVWSAGRQRNRAVLSAVFFLPLLLSASAIAVAWRAMMDPNFGVAKYIGPYLGFPDSNMIGDPKAALYVIVFVLAWQFVAFHSLMYQAATRNIPAMLYDAATVDGANRWHTFRYVTLPQLRNTIITSSTIMIVGSLTYFETILLLTKGGPGDATATLPYLMYQDAFNSYELGFAATIAVVLIVLGTLVSMLIVRFSGFGVMRSTLEGV